MPPRTRRYDHSRIESALLGQWQALLEHLPGLDPDLSATPALTGLTTGVRRLADQPTAPPRPGADPLDWARRGRLADLDPPVTPAPSTAAELAAELDRARRDLATGRTDQLVALVVQAVVYGEDLALPTPHRGALAVTVRLLADTLAATVPGRAVELRVPPFAAVQCVPGPTHTRGTPPAVVETDPLTWIRLATGRTDWAAAQRAGSLRASGDRADLTAYLPLLR